MEIQNKQTVVDIFPAKATVYNVQPNCTLSKYLNTKFKVNYYLGICWK